MYGYEIIPEKTKCITLSGNSESIDSEGLSVTLLADGGDINLKVRPSDKDEDSFTVKNGTTITLCGKFVIGAESAKAKLLFCRRL